MRRQSLSKALKVIMRNLLAEETGKALLFSGGLYDTDDLELTYREIFSR